MTHLPSLHGIHTDMPAQGEASAARNAAALARGAATSAIILRLENPSDLDRLSCWQDLLDASESAEKIYQSPAFMHFLRQGAQGERFQLYSITRPDDAEILGLVSIGLVKETLDMGVKLLAWLNPTLPVVRVFGSVALVHDSAGLADQVIEQLLAQFPRAAAISMQAVPAESAWWKALCARGPGVARTYVLNDWAYCHTITLPSTFDEYLKQFSAKKRYNLARQVRLLEKAAGPLQVQRIVDAGDVQRLLNAALTLASKQERRGLLTARDYAALADGGLLLSYVIWCGGVPCGVVIGSVAANVWHIYKILWANQYAGVSIGTSVLHLSIKDAFDVRTITRIDLGYGSPSREFSSSHLLKKRGHVLLYRPTLRNRMAIQLHAGVTACSTPLRRHAKQLSRKLGTLRKRVSSMLRIR